MNRIITKRVAAGVAALILLAVAGAVGYFLAQRSAPTASPSATTQPSGKKVLYWYDPMTPQQHFDHPGISPMGMQLVPKYATGNSSKARNIVRINPAEVQNLGMRTAVVKVEPLADTIQVPGTVTWDQNLTVTVSARTDATIEKLYVRAPLTTVTAGQPLAEILAPQWSAAAAQYFALRGAQSATGRSLRAAARARLHTLGMSDAVIRSLRAGSGTITLRAPIDGVVAKLNVTQGQQVGQGAPIMRINGLDKVWVNAAIPQAQSVGVHAGTPIVATVSAVPGKTFHGHVEDVLPQVDQRTRTQGARIVLDNPDHALAPGMFATVRIAGRSSAPHPLVPSEAVIATSVHTRVIEALGDGAFKPVRVETGRSADGMTVILAGLHGGERIVTSGQFLIDSEAGLSGALTRMQAGHTQAPATKSSSAKPNTMPSMVMPASAASAASAAGKPTTGRPVSAHAIPKRPASKVMSGMSKDMPMPATSRSVGDGGQP